MLADGVRKRKKKLKKSREYRKAKLARSSSTEQPALNILAIAKTNYQDDDALFEAQFRRYLLPNCSPSFRCDTMAHFPSAFTHCLNSGNINGLSDLFKSSMVRRCEFRLFPGAGTLSCESFLKFFELMNEIHPDRILYINTTNVVNGRITAALCMKYTDCKALYPAVARTVTDPSLFRIVPATRTQLSTLLQQGNQSEEQQKLADLMDSDSDLVVYGWAYVTIRFDDIAGKVTSFQMTATLTSAQVAEVTLS